VKPFTYVLNTSVSLYIGTLRLHYQALTTLVLWYLVAFYLRRIKAAQRAA
jgi:ABC-type uncharacterized transport system permease subunit